MTIAKLLGEGRKIFSFEFFPPKDSAGEQQLYQTIEELRSLEPAFVSVTYGAMGTNQDGTLFFVKKVQQELNVEVMAHFTCICAEEDKVRFFLRELSNVGIHNILALRGDIPEEMSREEVFAGPLRYASDLVSFIRKQTQGFTVVVAGYPEGHVEAPSLDVDITHLKEKVDAGADAVITQLFFNNERYFEYCDKVRAAGIDIPIIPGIMPVQTARQIKIFSEKCGVVMPREILDFFSDPAVTKEAGERFGITYATQQCQDLLAHGAPGIHFYTLNKSAATREICKTLKDDLK